MMGMTQKKANAHVPQVKGLKTFSTLPQKAVIEPFSSLKTTRYKGSLNNVKNVAADALLFVMVYLSTQKSRYPMLVV